MYNIKKGAISSMVMLKVKSTTKCSFIKSEVISNNIATIVINTLFV